MKLTRKQIVYGLVLVVALVALVIDKLFFSSPAAADAAPAVAQAPVPQGPVKTDAAAPIAPALPAPADGLISDHLKLIPSVDLNEMPDAFAPSKVWMLAIRPPPPELPPAPPPAPKVDHSAADFFAAHKLSGVLESHNGGAAIVDGQMLRVGQTLDGFTLVSVQANSAHFNNGTVVADLTMDQ